MESVACDNTKGFTGDLRLRFLVYPAQGFFHDITGLSHWNDVKTVALCAKLVLVCVSTISKNASGLLLCCHLTSDKESLNESAALCLR